MLSGMHVFAHKGSIGERSLEAREFVMNASVEALQSEGAGELMRLSKIISLDNDPDTQLTLAYRARSTACNCVSMADVVGRSVNSMSDSRVSQQLLIEQDTVLQSKLQQAFMYAVNSNMVQPGAKELDALLIKRYASAKERAKPLSPQQKLDVCQYIVASDGRELVDLNKDELEFIFNQLKRGAGPMILAHYLPQHRAINLVLRAVKSAQQTFITRRTLKTPQSVVQAAKNLIQHRTTLIAQINRCLLDYLQHPTFFLPLSTQQALMRSITELCMRAAHNHWHPQRFQHAIIRYLQHADLLKGRQQIKASRARIVDYTQSMIQNALARFCPPENLGAQMHSPHAKKMENLLAAALIEQPTAAMTRLMKKMMQQLKHYFDDHLDVCFESKMQDFVQCEKWSGYAVAQKANFSDSEIVDTLASPCNLALFINFHFYCSMFIQKAPSTCLVNDGEIKDCWLQKTYVASICELRGDRVLLPRLSSVEKAHSCIGVGLHNEAIVMDRIQAPFSRACTEKMCFGEHAKQAAHADAAQACGISGCANIHFWGQALVNQRAPAELKLSKPETQLLMIMMSAVMIADGGHTINEILLTAKLVSFRAQQMSSSSFGLVDELVGHLAAITDISNPSGCIFNHYDRLFAELNDPELGDMLYDSWKDVVSSL